MIDIDKIIEPLWILVDKYDINTPRRMAHFLAQVDHESAALTRLTENLNYSVKGLIRTFNRSRISLEDAALYGRSGRVPANQEAIANIIYGGEWGRKNLGNTEPGDGWRFRGRGPIMCTGRRNYARFARYSGIPVDVNPDIMARVPTGLQFAGYFWQQRNINAMADVDDINGVRRLVNGGLIGIDDCVNKYRQYVKVITADHQLFKPF